MNIFDSIDILAGGLSAERVRMDVTASNMANARSTRTVEGGPYRRRDAVFATQALSDEHSFGDELEQALQTPTVTEVSLDQSKPRRIFDPHHPDADKGGYVAMPNVNIVEEMVNMITSQRSYEAAVTTLHGLVDMSEKALGLGK